MSITTKKGDNGSTSLLSGRRVRKDDLRIEANGILDELISTLGLSKSLLKDTRRKDIIARIQKELGVVCSEIAADTPSHRKRPRVIEEKDIKGLESFIEKLERQCKVKRRSFSLPGGNTASATLDIARSIARTAERRVVALENKKLLKNHRILAYLNRLSDLLYLLAVITGKRRT